MTTFCQSLLRRAAATEDEKNGVGGHRGFWWRPRVTAHMVSEERAFAWMIAGDSPSCSNLLSTLSRRGVGSLPRVAQVVAGTRPKKFFRWAHGITESGIGGAPSVALTCDVRGGMRQKRFKLGFVCASMLDKFICICDQASST